MARSNTDSKLGLLVRHELRSIMRDRKTVILSVLLPLLVMPLLFVVIRWTEERKQAVAEARTHTYAVVGEDAAWLQSQIERGLEVLPESDDPPPKVELKTVEDPATALEGEDLHAYLTTKREQDQPPLVEVHYRGNREASRDGAEALKDALEAARTQERQGLLEQHGLSLEVQELAAIEAQDVASEGEAAGLTLGKFMTMALVLLVMTGGQVVAADIMAGEKERGTLETLITTAADRHEIVLSKLLTITTVALGITLINVANLLVYVSFGLLPGADTIAGSLPPVAVVVLAVLFIPVALLISSLLLLVSGYARSFKEAQLFAFPLQLLVLVPALAAILPNIELRSAIALVPIANVSIACRDILTGHFDWLVLVVVVVANSAVALWTARHVGRALEEERLVAPAAADSVEAVGGPAAFQQHVLRWIAAVWAILMIAAANWVTDIRAQLFLNLVVLMLGSSILMVKRYRLDIREAWALRKPPAIAWLLVLLGAPAGLIVGQGVFELSSLVLPVPMEALESFSEALLPEDIPMWQLLIMLTIFPGVCEEIFFRGMLLHGLRKRLGPVALCLVVGLVFGFFHIALFRLIPTGFIGIMLAAVTLLTGSIFPAMLWHALNNLLGVLSGEAGLSPTDIPPELYAVATVLLALVFVMFWRYRRVYPDLRARRPYRSSNT